MPILLKPVRKTNPQRLTEAPKWYVTQARVCLVDEDQVASDIAEGTTLNPSEAMMAIRQLRKVLLHHLQNGESVRLGNWGSFSLSISSTPSDTMDEVGAHSIRSINLNFRADESFKADLQKTTCVWLNRLASDGRGCTPAPSAPVSMADGGQPAGFPGTDTGEAEGSGRSPA